MWNEGDSGIKRALMPFSFMGSENYEGSERTDGRVERWVAVETELEGVFSLIVEPAAVTIRLS